MALHLIVAMTGASGAYAAELLLKKSPWPSPQGARELRLRHIGSLILDNSATVGFGCIMPLRDVDLRVSS